MTLDQQMRAVLTRLMLCGDGATSQLSLARAKSTPGHRVLHGDQKRDRPDWEILLNRFNGCRTDSSRAVVLTEAREALRLATHSQAKRPENETQAGRLKVGREAAQLDKQALEDFAKRLGYSAEHVRRLVRLATEVDRQGAESRARARGQYTLDQRTRIAAEAGSALELSVRHGVSERTIQRWRATFPEGVAV